MIHGDLLSFSVCGCLQWGKKLLFRFPAFKTHFKIISRRIKVQFQSKSNWLWVWREGYCLFLAILDSNDALMLPALPFFLHLTYLRRKSWLVSRCYPQIQGFTCRSVQANYLLLTGERVICPFLRAFLVRLMGSLFVCNPFHFYIKPILWCLFNVL